MTSIRIAVTIDRDLLQFLKSRGISRSKLLTQATQAIRKGRFEYQYLED